MYTTKYTTDSVKQILTNTNNDNVVKTINNNVNVYGRNEKDNIADKLVDELNNPVSRNFYCKVAWRLSEGQIWSNLEKAKQGKNPRRYFTWLCKKQMG